jgi:phosphoribosyl 1,2-cyclic phosphodiesterase/ActR/RegA family two-component response regulator
MTLSNGKFGVHSTSAMKTVLLIDDDAVVRGALSRHLEQEGWTVWQADDGDTGLPLFHKHNPAAVVTDLLMPSVNGFQVISQLRREPLSHTRVIAISTKNFPSDKQRALELGADLFLAKPISPAGLSSLLDDLTYNSPRVKTASTGLTDKSMLMRFWGVRGSVPSPGPGTVFYGGNTSCIEVRAEGEIIILDSGTGIRELGVALASEFDGKPLKLTILISHTHWDHIQGFPFFSPAYNPKNQITILGYEGAKAGLTGILTHQMESLYFPVELKELPGNIIINELKAMEFQIGKVKVKTMFLNHPGVCVGYRLESSSGSLAYLPDNEPFQRRHSLERMDAISDQGVASTTAFAFAEDEKLVEFIRDVDLLIIDSQYDAEEYRHHIGWGHGCSEDAVTLASRAGVKRLYLFHHDPNHDDATISTMVENARKLAASQATGLKVFAAREGESCHWPIDREVSR